MIPIIVGGAAAVLAGVAAYQKYKASQSKPAPEPTRVSLGRFAIWGRPNVGKSTFINRLRGQPGDFRQKEATTARTVYRDIPVNLGTSRFRIAEIADMPGTLDRLQDWLELVDSHEHIFYLLNLSNDDSGYLADVRNDLKETVKALAASKKPIRRLHIIASHVDQSYLKDVEAAQVNNTLQGGEKFRRLYESIEGVAGYVYAANLTDQSSFERLLESIIRDANA